MSVETEKIANSWYEIKQKCITFTHLKFTAIHNFKWVKILINKFYLAGQGLIVFSMQRELSTIYPCPL